MFRFLAVALVCVLLPRVGFAQETSAPTTPSETVVAPPLVSAPEEAELEPFEPETLKAPPTRAEEGGGMPAAPRIVLETLAGGVGMIVGGLLGLIAGIATTDCTLDEGDCSTAAVLGLGGMALGASGATYAAGSLMKGEGSLLGTFIGSALGTGAGLLVLMAEDNDETMGTIAMFSLPAIGAMAGYEMGRSAQPSAGFSLRGGGVSVTPAIGSTPRGGFMGGLVGRF
ncbi:hypothetical protein ACLESO_04470 [Pyxidicoccus sp. 3LG]